MLAEAFALVCASRSSHVRACWMLAVAAWVFMLIGCSQSLGVDGLFAFSNLSYSFPKQLSYKGSSFHLQRVLAPTGSEPVGWSSTRPVVLVIRIILISSERCGRKKKLVVWHIASLALGILSQDFSWVRVSV